MISHDYGFDTLAGSMVCEAECRKSGSGVETTTHFTNIAAIESENGVRILPMGAWPGVPLAKRSVPRQARVALAN
jgi:hypothetical protein